MNNTHNKCMSNICTTYMDLTISNPSQHAGQGTHDIFFFEVNVDIYLGIVRKI